MIAQLIAAQEQVVRTARHAMPIAEDAKDAPTADLLIERRMHTKNTWMLRSLLKVE